MLGMTPHFTIRVWGNTQENAKLARRLLPKPPRELLCDIEVDTTAGQGQLTINGHRGLDFIAQKMLTASVVEASP